MNENEILHVDEQQEHMPGIIAILGELESGAIITEDGLARLFNRHVTSVKRAIHRGELPRPVKLFGQNSWTVGALQRHIESRLQAAQEDADNTDRRIAALSP
jgi:hypothetical protein